MHTPGPWEYDGHAEILKWNDDRTSGDIIAEVSDCSFTDQDEEGFSATAVANARLIAAAPELLEACRRGLELALEIQEERDDMDKENPDADLFAAAIAKAEANS